MHLIVNALSIGSMSGQHVVYGFLRPMADTMLPEHQITVVHYAGETPPADLIAAGVKTVEVASKYRKWYRRLIWEQFNFGRIAKQIKADKVLSVSGALTPGCQLPQIVLCQNPWCYVPAAQIGIGQKIKAALQRVGYSRAFRKAEKMVYISNHLRSLYGNAHPGQEECSWDIAYVGLNASTFAAAERLKDAPRKPLSIISVSAMAPWKGAATLVEAVRILRARGMNVTLDLVGPWPVASHRAEIEAAIEQGGLSQSVKILGKVSDDELHELYATRQVFCLMSGCESFGIPAAEAMCFGTPVVSTDCCAIAEICETAGKFGPTNDPNWTADALQLALTDESTWKQWSENAKKRAAELTWQQCASSFYQIPSL